MAAKKQATAKAPAPAKEAGPKLVKMVRSSDFPAPHECDCHPAEVENFRAGGWQEA